MTKERPVLFKDAMVRAILNGTKTQTRRIAKPRKKLSLLDGSWTDSYVLNEGNRKWLMRDNHHGQPGDRLWVRETFSGPHCMERSEEFPAVPPSQWPTESPIWYWADGEPNHGDWTKPRPSMFMPRWASRITLEITDVRVERLQDISVADALAEGVNVHPDHHGKPRESIYSPVQAYQDLWESINGPDSWEANPWVWVIGFRKV